MEMLQGAWEQHLRPRAVVGYGVKFSSQSSKLRHRNSTDHLVILCTLSEKEDTLGSIVTERINVPRPVYDPCGADSPQENTLRCLFTEDKLC